MKTFFDRTNIGNLEIKNRFVVAPMTRVSANLQGIPSEEMQDYYTAFAQGGFGGIITEGIYTDDLYSKSYPNQPGLVNTEQVNGWKKIVKKIHDNDALVIAQLMHAGSISQILPITKAPSKILPLGQKLPHYGGGAGLFPVAEEMTKQDIEYVVIGFANAAKNAITSGFDGVELHSANGYLLDQFITPYLNLRTDEFGGDISKMVRIIRDITKRIKEFVPPNFILGLRISEGKVNNLNYRWDGGSDTAKALLSEIGGMPIDYLHVAAEHSGWESEVRYSDGSSLTGLAREILDCPVIANGKLHELKLAKKLLNSNQADLIAVGKSALANPDFVNKISNNEELIPFDGAMLQNNPSLFSDEKHKRCVEEYENALCLN